MFMKEKLNMTNPRLDMGARRKLIPSEWRRQSAAEKARYKGLAEAANQTEQDAADLQFRNWMGGEGRTGPKTTTRERRRKREAVTNTFAEMRNDGLWNAGTGVFCFDGPLVGSVCMGN